MEDIFGGFVADVNSAGVKPVANVNLLGFAGINNSVLFDAIENNKLDSISDSDLYKMVCGAHLELFRRIMSKDSRYVTSVLNVKLLNVLIQVATNIPLSLEERICCNKIVYDYMTYEGADEFMKGLVLSLAKAINKDIIPGLCGLGLDVNLAIFLACARFSSTDIAVCVKRVNFIIITQPSVVMSEQIILNIFEKLYDKFTEVFETCMLETINNEEEWVTDDMDENFSRISLVLLDILNVMPSQSIIHVLRSYCDDYELLHAGSPVRFDITNIAAGDYGRILECIAFLQGSGKKFPR